MKEVSGYCGILVEKVLDIFDMPQELKQDRVLLDAIKAQYEHDIVDPDRDDLRREIHLRKTTMMRALGDVISAGNASTIQSPRQFITEQMQRSAA